VHFWQQKNQLFFFLFKVELEPEDKESTDKKESNGKIESKLPTQTPV
jgi:hypothetical protein